MVKVRTPQERAEEFRTLLMAVGRVRSLRDPIASLSEQLSPPQIHTLMWLKSDGKLPLSTIAQRVGCSAPTMTGVMDRLERMGLCQRERHQTDRRVVLCGITAQGKKLAQKFDDAFAKQATRFFAALSHDDGEALLAILQRLLASFSPSVADDAAEGTSAPPPSAHSTSRNKSKGSP